MISIQNPYDLLFLITILMGFSYIGYLAGRDRGIDYIIKSNNEAIKIAAGFIRRYDQILFSHTLLKKINAISVEIPEGFFDG